MGIASLSQWSVCVLQPTYKQRQLVSKIALPPATGVIAERVSSVTDLLGRTSAQMRW